MAHHRGAGLGIGRLGIGLPGLECRVETALRGTGNLPLEFSIEPQLDDLITLHVRRVDKLLTTLIAEHQAVNTAELRGDGAGHVAVRLEDKDTRRTVGADINQARTIHHHAAVGRTERRWRRNLGPTALDLKFPLTRAEGAGGDWRSCDFANGRSRRVVRMGGGEGGESTECEGEAAGGGHGE